MSVDFYDALIERLDILESTQVALLETVERLTVENVKLNSDNCYLASVVHEILDGDVCDDRSRRPKQPRNSMENRSVSRNNIESPSASRNNIESRSVSNNNPGNNNNNIGGNNNRSDKVNNGSTLMPPPNTNNTPRPSRNINHMGVDAFGGLNGSRPNVVKLSSYADQAKKKPDKSGEYQPAGGSRRRYKVNAISGTKTDEEFSKYTVEKNLLYIWMEYVCYGRKYKVSCYIFCEECI